MGSERRSTIHATRPEGQVLLRLRSFGVVYTGEGMTEDTEHVDIPAEGDFASLAAQEQLSSSVDADLHGDTIDEIAMTPVADPPKEPTEAAPEPPRPMRTGPRPARRELVPLWVYGVIVAILALVALGIGVSLAVNRSVTREVPNVTGLDSDVARTRLRSAGFEFEDGDRRFSVKPLGTVLEQSPDPGALVRRGSTVSVVVSAGTEQFALPDIVSNGIILARGILEDRGLEVKVITEASDKPKDTVLSTNPAAGSIVHTGDIVIVAVASPETVSSAIVPYRFSKTRFVLDPSKPTSGIDVPLEVARRLRSLLEASGAIVVVTRAQADTDTSVENRSKRAADARATVIVGLDVATTGSGGFALATPSGLAPARRIATGRLEKSLSRSLTVRGKAPRETTFAPDALVKATQAPLARVSLGSISSRDDAASFRDPAWADQVARAIYSALGGSYGTR